MDPFLTRDHVSSLATTSPAADHVFNDLVTAYQSAKNTPRVKFP
jgi:hypothetical protein